MLDRLARQSIIIFLDVYSSFNKIVISLKDQHKTTFTCPYGTYDSKRMLFGVYNAPATFQQCMRAIFYDMIWMFIKIFMDDFSIFGNSFDIYLNNIDMVLAHCEETNLVLNMGKYHCLVIVGIVLGHKGQSHRLEVNLAKVDVIEELPPPV